LPESLPQPATNAASPAALRSLYLNLLKRSLTNTLFDLEPDIDDDEFHFVRRLTVQDPAGGRSFRSVFDLSPKLESRMPRSLRSKGRERECVHDKKAGAGPSRRF